MKKIIYSLAILAVYSCSDKLNNSQVKNLMKDCNKDLIDIKSKVVFGSNINFIPKDIHKLASLGMMKIDSVKKKSLFFDHKDRYLYEISFTPQGRNFILSTELNKKTVNAEDSLALVKSCEIHLFSIDEIHEIPAENKAEVRVTYLAKDRTPFSLLLSENDKKSDTIKLPNPVIFKKTNSGWKLCDD